MNGMEAVTGDSSDHTSQQGVVDDSAATQAQFVAAFNAGALNFTAQIADPQAAVVHTAPFPPTFAPPAAVQPANSVAMQVSANNNTAMTPQLWMPPATMFQVTAAAAAAAAAAATITTRNSAETDEQAPAAMRPTFVNAKQYRRILKRREARAWLEEHYRNQRDTDIDERKRKPYQYESRHRHAKKRPRGEKGRFLSKAELADYYKEHPNQGTNNSSPSGDESDRQSSTRDPLELLMGDS